MYINIDTKEKNMSKRTIIHIADAHISKAYSSQTSEMLKALIKDIKNQAEGNIDFIIFSGDLVQSGKEENFSFALDSFIMPLLQETGVSEDRFIYVPGNHEVDIDKIDNDFAIGFTDRILRDGVKDEDFKNLNVQNRLKGFFSFSELFFKWNQEEVAISRKIELDGITYGISYVNTAWNSAGDSSKEAKKVIVPREALVKSFNDISSCDKKIILMHHPIDWFEDDNAYDVESILNKYDFVLTGHKHHESSKQYVHANGRTIVNAVSKLDISGNENGYAIIDLEDDQVVIKNRKYIKKRMEYAPDVNITDDGIVLIQLSSNNTGKQLLVDTILNTKKGFNNSLDELFITNLIETGTRKKFEDLFVMPVMDKHSELVKERNDDPERPNVNIIQEIMGHKYSTIWGRKETGKTILANYVAKTLYDNYAEYKLLPVILDCRFLATSKTAILSAVGARIKELLKDDCAISKKDIEQLAKEGAILIIFDNYDADNPKRKIQLDYFELLYPNNKFLFFRDETPAVFSDEDRLALMEQEENADIVNLFIRSMDKHNIRQLAKNMLAINPSIEDAHVDKIIRSFSTNNMPRTPFAVSLILAICGESADYMPTNQAKIVENFMEKLLEKLNPEEVYSRTYDFNNKEKFLAEIAYELHSSNRYYMSKDEFTIFTIKYHENKGYELRNSKFDKLFFEKGILIEYNDNVFFRYECLAYYYLAKYCFKNRQYFEERILSKDNYLQNAETISYYAGLNREDEKLIATLIEYAKPYIEKNVECGNLLEIDSIKLELDIPDEEIKERIAETKQLSTKEKDELTDLPDRSIGYNPVKMKVDVKYNENTAFAMLIELIGEVLRSSEELLVPIKKESFSIFLKGCIILWKQFRESLLDFAKEVNEEIILKKKAKEGENFEEIKKSLEKSYTLFCDVLKLSVPIAIAGFAFDSVGTDKMKKIYVDIYNECPDDKPEKLLMCMLLCDLKINNWDKVIKEYIKNTSKKDFLLIMFFKCQYYLQFNYFGDETKKIIEPTADCYIAAHNMSKLDKSRIIGAIEKHKLLPGKKVE